MAKDNIKVMTTNATTSIVIHKQGIFIRLCFAICLLLINTPIIRCIHHAIPTLTYQYLQLRFIVRIDMWQ